MTVAPEASSIHLNMRGKVYTASKDESTLLVVNRMREEVDRLSDKNQKSIMHGFLDVLCHR